MNMKPKISILDRAFAYKPSYATAIAETWRRFGWHPAKRDAPEPQARPRIVNKLPRTWRSERATFSQVLRTWQRQRAANGGRSV
jgi:hypothetical protein